MLYNCVFLIIVSYNCIQRTLDKENIPYYTERRYYNSDGLQVKKT